MGRDVAPAVALIAALVLACAVLPPAPAQAQAQDPDPVDSGLVERAEVSLGLLDVVVLDRRGRHVRGVPAEAFRLFADGEPVPMIAVDEIDLVAEGARTTRRSKEAPVPVAAADAADPGGARDEAATLAALADGLAEAREARASGTRWFVMVFDGYNNVSPLRMSQVRTQAKRWIERNKRPGDLVAIYSFNPYLNSLVGFTGEQSVLFDAIDSAPIFPAGEGMGRDMIAQRLEQGERLPREFLEQQLLNASRFGEDLLAAERDTYYENMALLGDALGSLPGTKAVLLFSGGFPLTRSKTTGASGGLTPMFRSMMSVLTERGVRVFSYDVGEEGAFTDAEQATNFRLQLDQLGLGTDWLDTLQIGAQVSGVNAHQEILSALGTETGGRFFAGRNYRDALDAADDDLSHYYLLTYDRSGGDRSGGRSPRYVDLEVKIADGGYRVITRRGRFEAPADERPVGVVPDAGLAARVEPERPRRSAATPVLELHGRPSCFPAGDGRTVVMLSLRSGTLPALQRVGDLTMLDATLTVDVAGADGVKVSGERDLRLELPSGVAGSLSEGIRLREGVVVDGDGPVVVDVLLRLNGLGTEARWTGEVQLPAWGDGEAFGLADLVVFEPLDRAPVVFDAFFGAQSVHTADGAIALADPLGERGGERRAATYIDGALPTAVPLLVQTVVLNPPAPPADGSSPLRMDWQLDPPGGGEPVFPPVRYRRLNLADGGGSLEVLVDLDVSAVPPGEYRLRLSAENVVQGGEAAAETSIRLAR